MLKNWLLIDYENFISRIYVNNYKFHLQIQCLMKQEKFITQLKNIYLQQFLLQFLN